MSVENPTNNVFDLAAARERRQGGLEKREAEQGVDFLVVFRKYGDKFATLNKEFQKILDDEQIPEEDKAIARRQVDMNKFEILRLLHVTARYQSYEMYAKKIDGMLQIFHMSDGQTRQRANRSLQDMEAQLSEFAQVFEDYGIPEEQEKIATLREKILQGFTLAEAHLDQEGVLSEPAQTEHEEAFAADTHLVEDLLHEMNTGQEYDLLVVEKTKKALEDFARYREVFEIYRLSDKVEQYRKMSDDLGAALARYENRDA